MRIELVIVNLSRAMLQTMLAEISQFLTVETVTRTFQIKTRSQEDVSSVSVSRAAPAGSGLLGAVYRITVKGDKHKASFIVKTMAHDPLLKRTLRPEKYFQREAYFFGKILPMLIDNQKSCGAKECIQNFVSVCYDLHCDGVNDFILLEDLSDSGCVSVSEYPTILERDQVLKTLAHFHAVGMALKVKQPKEFSKLIPNLSDQYYTENNRNWYAAYFKTAIDMNLKILAEFEDPKTSVYYEKFYDVVTNDPYSQMIKMLKDHGSCGTINHGDAWTPNFLYSKARGAVVIDFQLVRMTSVATDLSYLLILSDALQNDTNKSLEGIKMYHDALSYYLKDMNIDVRTIYPFEEMQSELKRFGKFGSLAAVSSLILLMSERCDNMQSFEEKFQGLDKIPLEKLWALRDLETEDEKMVIVNAVRKSVDLGFI